MASRLYSGIISYCDPKVPSKLRPLWNHPAGPKTVFFWSPGKNYKLSLFLNSNFPFFVFFSIQMGN